MTLKAHNALWYVNCAQGSNWEKVPLSLLCLPSLPPLKLALFWPLIDANISDQLPKSQKTQFWWCFAIWCRVGQYSVCLL